MKKIISLLLAIVIVAMTFPVVAFAADAGDVNDDGKVSAVDARLVLQVVAGLLEKSDLKNSNVADVNADNKISAVDARMILQVVAGLKPDNDTDNSSDSVIAQYVAIFNEESAKAANGTYNWIRDCDFSRDIDLGESTDVLNTIIKNIDSTADLNSVVGGFLGVGRQSGTQADAGKYAIKAMSLTENDVEKYESSSEQITLYLKNSSNPTADGNTPFNHLSNDFVTEADVNNAIASATTLVNVSDCTFNYNNVKVTARIGSSGKPTGLTISYTMYAEMKFKMSDISLSGNGEVETVIRYLDIKY